MAYYESAEGMAISKERAKKEIEKHGSSWSEFLLDNPEKDEYDAQDVLAWLGVLIMNMTAEQFKALTGFDDTQDDLERVNCPKAGQPGHESCGLNTYGLPAFMGRNLKPEDLPINQK